MRDALMVAGLILLSCSFHLGAKESHGWPAWSTEDRRGDAENDPRAARQRRRRGWLRGLLRLARPGRHPPVSRRCPRTATDALSRAGRTGDRSRARPRIRAARTPQRAARTVEST